ncbi:MAG: hypothetical protein EOO34_00145 [Cyanobacteriota bacterium]|nr:MAG: hypothetical protein EOO34_00145 [Cyanobacteriota bacterium]
MEMSVPDISHPFHRSLKEMSGSIEHSLAVYPTAKHCFANKPKGALHVSQANISLLLWVKKSKAFVTP